MLILLIAAFSLFCVSVVMDVLIRLRLRDVGEKRVFLRGATLDYRLYLKHSEQQGWSRWPAYLIYPFFLLGLAFLIWALSRMSRA